MTEQSFLKKYVPDGAGKVSDADDPRHYRPWRSYRDRESRLKIINEKGERHILQYGHMLDACHVPPNRMCLMFPRLTVIIKGANLKLDELEELIQDEKVRYIQAFNAKRFDEPAANDDEGKIDSIEFIDPGEAKPDVEGEGRA